MTEELFAYLMDDLPADRRAEVEAKLAADPAWQMELERLHQCLAQNDNPCDCLPEEEPPADLVHRTCCLVEKISDHPSASAPKPASKTRRALAAFTAASPCLGPHVRRWRIADITIGSAVALMVGSLMLPALFETRAAARRATCQDNLRTFGTALFDYQQARNQQLPPVRPGETAGTYALQLVNSGVVSSDQVQQIIVCPESPLADQVFAGRVVIVVPRRDQLRTLSAAKQRDLMRLIGGSYAYRMGYRDENGDYRQVPFTGQARSPLMADAPSDSEAGLRSANHHGNGLNVIDQNMQVRFQTECMLGGDNIYTNDDGEQAAGLDAQDIVLGPSDIGPEGRPFQLAPVR
jgi:hypothetical protein